MPPLYLSRQEKWKDEMKEALTEIEDSPFSDGRNAFNEGFLQRQRKTNGCLKRQITTSKSHTVETGFNRPKDHESLLNENDRVSEHCFLDGFSQRQAKNQTNLQTKSPGPNRVKERGAEQIENVKDTELSSGKDFIDGYSQRQAKKQTTNPSSSNQKYCSGNDFVDGFLRQSKPESDPCGALRPDFYEQELLANANNQKIQPLDAHYTKEDSIASTQTKPRNEFLDHKTESLGCSRGGSRRRLEERGGLNESSYFDSSSQYTRDPSPSSIKTPSPSTQYISTKTSSSTSSNSYSSPCKLEKESVKGSNDQTDSPKYIREPLTTSIRTPSPSTQYTSTSTTSSHSTRCFGECPKISEAEWKKIEKKSQNEQKEFLEKFAKAGRFREEELCSVKKNVKRGDHIFCHGMFGELYDHHLLCTHVDGEDIYVIEYTKKFGLAAASYSVASSNPFIRALVATKQGKLTYQELEKKKAKVRIWPKELERFSGEEVISRALSRINERDYHAFNNNCEHFVTWCKCGLNTSLQVKPWYQPAWDTVKGAGTATIQGIKSHGISKGVPALLKTFGNFSDELLGAISGPLSPVGFAIGGVIETAYAASYIYDDWKRMKQDRLSEDQFRINSVKTASQAACHIVGGITGSVVGSVVGPLGSAAGGAVGYAAGHAVGTAIGVCYEYAPKIKKEIQEKIIRPVKDMVQSCVKAVKTVVPEIWEGVQSALSSLFSWWI